MPLEGLRRGIDEEARNCPRDCREVRPCLRIGRCHGRCLLVVRRQHGDQAEAQARAPEEVRDRRCRRHRYRRQKAEAQAGSAEEVRNRRRDDRGLRRVDEVRRESGKRTGGEVDVRRQIDRKRKRHGCNRGRGGQQGARRRHGQGVLGVGRRRLERGSGLRHVGGGEPLPGIRCRPGSEIVRHGVRQPETGRGTAAGCGRAARRHRREGRGRKDRRCRGSRREPVRDEEGRPERRFRIRLEVLTSDEQAAPGRLCPARGSGFPAPIAVRVAHPWSIGSEAGSAEPEPKPSALQPGLLVGRFEVL